MDIQLRLALIYLLASPPPQCHCPHEWVKNGTKNNLQRYKCNRCGKTKTEGDRAKGRQKTKCST